nr:MAG TPA: hypothetical protein [Caudoviricetes sp.]
MIFTDIFFSKTVTVVTVLKCVFDALKKFCCSH